MKNAQNWKPAMVSKTEESRELFESTLPSKRNRLLHRTNF